MPDAVVSTFCEFVFALFASQIIHEHRQIAGAHENAPIFEILRVHREAELIAGELRVSGGPGAVANGAPLLVDANFEPTFKRAHVAILVDEANILDGRLRKRRARERDRQRRRVVVAAYELAYKQRASIERRLASASKRSPNWR